MTAQLILGLSILVGVHEFGHLLAAKFFGMRVEKYSIGFPPKLFSFKYGDTEYSLGALPLGGFVKISGMIDESLDKKHLGSEPQPWEYRSKPAWQRLIVMLGGVIVNIFTGILIFIALVYFLGEVYLSVSEVNKYGIYVNELGKEIGLQRGDKLIAVNGQEVESFYDFSNPSYLLESNAYYTVLRDGKAIDLPIPPDFLDMLSEREDQRNFLAPLEPFKVGKIMPNSPAQAAGLQEGDKILSINGEKVAFFQDFKEKVQGLKGQTVQLEVQRFQGETPLPSPVLLTATISDQGTLGFYSQPELQPSRHMYTLAEAIPKGVADAFQVITVQLKAFGKIFSGEVSASKSLSGPIGIAQVFGGTWNWLRFWTLTGMLSMVLAFMNLLPIPALDGGHVVFITYEMISGRPPSDRFLENAQKIGMIILLFLMVFAFGNDIVRLFS